MPIVPSIQELNRRIIAHIDDHGLRTIVIYLSDLRNDPTLRYDNLGDTFGDRAITLIQYCRDNRCMSQLIDLLKSNNPVVLSVQQPPPDPIWDEWAQQRDSAFTAADTPAPPPTLPGTPAAPPISPTTAARSLPPGISQYDFQYAVSMANRLQVYGEIADLYAVGWSLANHGRALEAADYYQQALSTSKGAGDLNAQVNILSDLARLYLGLARPADARAVAFSLMEVGGTYAAQGQYQLAWASYGQAYNVFMSIGDLVSANSCSMQALALGQNFPPW